MSSLYILLKEALKLTEKSAYIPIISFKKIESRIERYPTKNVYQDYNHNNVF